MNPTISAELTRCRIADQHRDAQHSRLVQEARKARRQQRRSGAQTVSGHPASVPTTHALALLGARSPRTAR